MAIAILSNEMQSISSFMMHFLSLSSLVLIITIISMTFGSNNLLNVTCLISTSLFTPARRLCNDFLRCPGVAYIMYDSTTPTYKLVYLHAYTNHIDIFIILYYAWICKENFVRRGVIHHTGKHAVVQLRGMACCFSPKSMSHICLNKQLTDIIEMCPRHSPYQVAIGTALKRNSAVNNGCFSQTFLHFERLYRIVSMGAFLCSRTVPVLSSNEFERVLHELTLCLDIFAFK